MSASIKGHTLIFCNLRNIFSEEDNIICLPYCVCVCTHVCLRPETEAK